MLPISADLFIPAITICVAIVAVMVVLARSSMLVRGRGLVVTGLVLLAVGNVSFLVRAYVPAFEQATQMIPMFAIIERSLLIYGGLLAVGFGVIRLLPDVASIERSRRLISHGVNQNEQVRQLTGLLDSVLRSGLGGTVCLRAVWDEAKELKGYEFRLVNPAAEQILGRAANSLIGKLVLKEFSCLAKHALLAEMRGVMETGVPLLKEHSFKQGEQITWFQIAVVPLPDGLTVTFADITTRKEIEEKLRHAAEHDALTGLVNRACLMEHVDLSLKRSKQDPSFAFAILFLDFDRFKLINDSMGHHTGDQLLLSIAERLRTVMRAISKTERGQTGYVISRLGGDEFVILLNDLGGSSNAGVIAEHLGRALNEPHRIGGHSIVSTASIGIVANCDDYNSADDILRDADTAMYQAKKAGKNRRAVFDNAMRRSVLTALEMENKLRAAVEQRSFFLEYQPLVRSTIG